MRLAELARAVRRARREPGHIRWIDLLAHQARLVESPLDIRDALREQMAQSAKAWIFTSATLGDDDRLSWFTEPAGLDDARVVRLGSPFDYRAHARVFVPRAFPKPNEPGHADAVAPARGALRARARRPHLRADDDAALAAGGRRAAARSLRRGRRRDRGAGPGPGRRSAQLMQRFLDAPRAVLVGSQSFWEGVDVPGDALQCVIIDKLPFPPPNDPLVEARVKRLESDGRNAFADYFVAEAAVALKQGAGRLIRSETDRGLLVVCDPRMATMGYGRRLFAALPPMTRLDDEAEAIAWLRELAGARRSRRALSRPWRSAALTRAATRRLALRRARRCQVSMFGKFVFRTRCGVVAQLDQAEPVVALGEDDERLLGRRRPLELLHRLLRAVGGRDVGAAPQVVARDVHLVRGERVDDVVHAQARVFGVRRLRELLDQLPERLVRVARRLLVALGQVLAREAAEHAEVVVEVDEALQVERVVERRAGRMQLDEALERRQRLRLLAALPEVVGALDLRLLRQHRCRRRGPRGARSSLTALS